jgi:hypothetical protein
MTGDGKALTPSVSQNATAEFVPWGLIPHTDALRKNYRLQTMRAAAMHEFAIFRDWSKAMRPAHLRATASIPSALR